MPQARYVLAARGWRCERRPCLSVCARALPAVRLALTVACRPTLTQPHTQSSPGTLEKFTLQQRVLA